MKAGNDIAQRGVIVLIVLTTLTACGGSTTRSDSGTDLPEAERDSVPTAPVIQTFTVPVDARVANFVSQPNSGGSRLGSPEVQNGTVSFDVLNGAVIAARGTIGGFSMDVDTRQGDTISISDGIVTAKDVSTGALVSFNDPIAGGFAYQTFGLWQEGPDAGLAGAVSGGSQTPLGGMPSPGSATAEFKGQARGFSNLGGTVSNTAADLTITTDFATADFTTTNTMRDGLDVTGPISAEELDLSGTLTVTGTGLSGSVTSGQGEVQSVGVVDVTGHFYGPNADEVGGTFSARDGVELGEYFGAFGAVRQAQ